MRKWECKKVIPLLDDYCQGLLAPESKEAVKGHLDRCSSCRKIWEETEDLLSLLKKEELPDPGTAFWEGMRDRIMGEVRRQARNGSKVPWTVRAFGHFPPRFASAWVAAVVLLIFLPLFLVHFFDFSADRPSLTVTVLPRASEGDEAHWAPRPEPLPKLMASLTEKESLRLAEKITSRLGSSLSYKTALTPVEEKFHWDVYRSLEWLEEEELEALIHKLDSGKSAGLMEGVPYVC